MEEVVVEEAAEVEEAEEEGVEVAEECLNKTLPQPMMSNQWENFLRYLLVTEHVQTTS